MEKSIFDDPEWGPYLLRTIKSEANKIALRKGKIRFADDIEQDTAYYFHRRYRIDPDFRERWHSTSQGEKKSYLSKAVRGIVLKSIENYDDVPTAVHRQVSDIWKMRKKIAEEKRIPFEDVSTADVAERLELREEYVQEQERLYSTLSTIRSLDEKFGEDGATRPVVDQSLRGERPLPADVVLARAEEYQRIQDILRRKMTEEERYVMDQHYREERSMSDIRYDLFNDRTKEKGVKRQRVNQIHDDVIARIQAALKAQERDVEGKQLKFREDKRKRL